MLIAYYTLGCKVNQYDTAAMRELLERAGHDTVEFDETADIYLINTCTVTNIADRKSRQMIGRAVQKGGKICVCGCLAQKDAQAMFDIPGVCAVVGSKNRSGIANIVRRIAAGERINAVEDILEEHNFEELTVSRDTDRVRAHLKICEGCNNFCTYCIVPYARGPVRSRKLEDITTEARRFAENGVREIVLTGVHISSYGSDFANNTRLLDVIHAVAASGVPRIRLGSLEPTLLTREFCKKIAEIPELCPHFHISLQSGCDSILNRMGRKYTAALYSEFVQNVREFFEDPSITTDIIAGFPEETDAEHAITLKFLQEIGFAGIHVFPYSERKGTPAAEMKQLPHSIRKARASEISELSKSMSEQYARSFIGKNVEVLAEEEQDGSMIGHTREYLRVSVQTGAGQIVSKELTGISKGILY